MGADAYRCVRFSWRRWALPSVSCRLPLATGIGSQAQKPLARVVVGGMLTAAVLILVVLPVLYEIVHRRTEDD